MAECVYFLPYTQGGYTMLNYACQISRPSNLDAGIMQTWLKRRLKEIGSNQAELAERLGRTPSQISRIGNGKQSVTLEQIEEIAEALDMDPPQLVSLMSSRARQTMPVAGYVTGDAEIADTIPAGAEHRPLSAIATVPRPVDIGRDARAFLAVDSRDRRYQRGDVIYCERVRLDRKIDDAQECYVELAGGRRLLRWVRPGTEKGRYTLVSALGDVIVDADLVAAYRVRALRTIDLAALPKQAVTQ
jgi:transcriptional regulator with XRE-family HTH domain